MSRLTALLSVFPLLLLAACGGGGGADAEAEASSSGALTAAAAPAGPSAAPTTGTAAAAPVSITSAARAAAASATAASTVNACAGIRPFYWEIGDRNARLAGASLVSPASPAQVTANSWLLLASASKWMYGAYVAQRLGGDLSDDDVRMLTMRSGYVSLRSCRPEQTVDACLADAGNGAYTAGADGRFSYNGGHMQQHASALGLGAMDVDGLTAELRSQLGAELDLRFVQPQPAGGMAGTPASYAAFLRKLLAGDLRLGTMLGAHAVCAGDTGCATGDVLRTPSPEGEALHYALGHWVEDDPVRSDGAFSSGGALGFYPWLDAERQFYGIVARQAPSGGPASLQCGRLIRKAWQTGTAL